jgi:hypothetical protein
VHCLLHNGDHRVFPDAVRHFSPEMVRQTRGGSCRLSKPLSSFGTLLPDPFLLLPTCCPALPVSPRRSSGMRAVLRFTKFRVKRSRRL